MAAADLTVSRLREVISYDPETGVFRWKVRLMMKAPAGSVAGANNGRGYLATRIDGHSIKLHRLAFVFMTGEWPKNEVDHINGVKDDNRWFNLRDVDRTTNTQNLRRARKDNLSSGLMGAYWDPKCQAWRSSIQTDGKIIGLGRFNSAADANAAYLEAKRRLHQGCTI